MRLGSRWGQNTAVALAEAAPVRRRGLRRLAAIVGRAGSTCGARGGPVATLELYGQVDLGSLGESAIDLALMLFPSHPALAYDLVRRHRTRPESVGSIEWGLAAASVKGTEPDGPTDGGPWDAAEQGEHEGAADFVRQVSLLLGDHGADDALREASLIADLPTRIRYLGDWCLRNARAAGAWRVAGYAVEQVVTCTDFVPSAHDLRKLAAVIPYADDPGLAAKMVDGLAPLADQAEHAGPQEEYVRFCLCC